eukprot:GHVQ01024488.1.p1 GENE.GHVQ01024488.1~~GHVQ01024488.1.p1  ORF type:complete len:1077 (+),score=135.34 GHVQ01024488.1:85-3315(+)
MADASSAPNCVSSVALENLNSIFQRTLSSAADVVAAGRESLLQLYPEDSPSKHVDVLLKFQLYSGAATETKWVAAIFFKNYVRSHWELPVDQGGLSDGDKNFVKQNILPLLLAVPNTSIPSSGSLVPTKSSVSVPGSKEQRLIQSQLSEALALISETEFPLKWPSLLTEIGAHLVLPPPHPHPSHSLEPIPQESTNGSGVDFACSSLTEFMIKRSLVLEVLYTVLKKYRSSAINLDNETATELKTIVDSLCASYTHTFKDAYERFRQLFSSTGQCAACVTQAGDGAIADASASIAAILSSKPVAPPSGVAVFSECWDYYYYSSAQCMLSLCKCYYCLVALEIPEFFEDNIGGFMDMFREVLQWKADGEYFRRFNVIENSRNADRGGVIELLKAEVCDILTLHADKYQEPFDAQVTACIAAVWNLLISLDTTERNDEMVSSGMRFLSAAAQTRWSFASGGSPYSDPSVLQQICFRIILPHVFLRRTDLENIEENPLEFIRKDMEGGDQHTRRSSAVNLIRAMAKVNSAELSRILLSLIEALCLASDTAGTYSQQLKDACTVLVMGLAKYASGATTPQGGCSNVAGPQFVQRFFLEQLLPELEHQDRNIGKAAAFKFITTFRQIVDVSVLKLALPIASKMLADEDPIVHTYAAHCVERLLTVRQPLQQTTATAAATTSATTPLARASAPTKLVPAEVKQTLVQCLEPLLHIVRTNRGIRENEYIVKCVMRIFTFLKKEGGECATATLSQFVEVLKYVANNPSNPSYNHYVFESIAAIVKTNAANQRHSETEAILVPVICTIVRQDVHEFIPYCFQILGLLLDISDPQSSISLYVDLFNFLMRRECWTTSKANVPGMVRLIAAYCRRQGQFGTLLKDNIQALLERFQYCFHNTKLCSTAAFELVNSMVRYLPASYYESHFKTLVTVLLARVNQQGTESMKQDVVVFFALYMSKVDNGEQILTGCLESMQPGLTSQFFSFVFFKAALKMTTLHEKKLMIVSVAKFTTAQGLSEDVLLKAMDTLAQLMSFVPSIETFQRTERSEQDDEQEGGVQSDFDVSYAQLSVAQVVTKDMVSHRFNC